MNELVKKITEFLEGLKNLLKLLEDLWETVKQHQRAVVILLILVGGYGALYWSAIHRPGDVIRDFYAAIDNNRRQEAWALLVPGLQQARWANDADTFAAGFKTTIGHSDLKVDHDTSLWNPAGVLWALLSASREYDVSFEVTDSFTQQDCQDATQHHDCLWLQVRNFTEYEQLMKGTLYNPEGSKRPTVRLVRFYKKRFTLRRNSSGAWLIANIDTREAGFKR
jgi:hypothetical protein